MLNLEDNTTRRALWALVFLALVVMPTPAKTGPVEKGQRVMDVLADVPSGMVANARGLLTACVAAALVAMLATLEDIVRFARITFPLFGVYCLVFLSLSPQIAPYGLVVASVWFWGGFFALYALAEEYWRNPEDVDWPAYISVIMLLGFGIWDAYGGGTTGKITEFIPVDVFIITFLYFRIGFQGSNLLANVKIAPKAEAVEC